MPSHPKSKKIENDLEFEWLLCLASTLQSSQLLQPTVIVHMVNQPRTIKRIFQIAYTEQLRSESAEFLRCLGYAVISVIGNEAAKALLCANPHNGLALFIVGHAASEQTRKEKVDWPVTSELHAKWKTVTRQEQLAVPPPGCRKK